MAGKSLCGILLIESHATECQPHDEPKTTRFRISGVNNFINYGCCMNKHFAELFLEGIKKLFSHNSHSREEIVKKPNSP